MRYKIPETVSGNRLTLRRFIDEDWRDLHAYYSDIDCMRFTMGKPLTESETWRSMSSMMGHWELRGYGPYGVESQVSRRIIGVCGLWYPLDWPEPEIKWGLAKNYWGQGFAREAAQLVKKVWLDHLPALPLISLIFAANTRSARLAVSLGASFEKEIEFRQQVAHIYRHSRQYPSE